MRNQLTPSALLHTQNYVTSLTNTPITCLSAREFASAIPSDGRESRQQ